MTDMSDKSMLVENDEMNHSESSELSAAHQRTATTTTDNATASSSSSAAAAARMVNNSPALRLFNREIDGLTIVVVSVIVFSLAVTIALVIHIIVGQPQVVPHAAVVSDDEQCSAIGLELIKTKKANAIDAAVSTYLCLTVTRPDLVSIGGDCGLLLYHRHGQLVTSSNSGHQPHATELFNGLCESSSSLSTTATPSPTTSKESVGLPRLFVNLFKIHQIHGHLKWSELFEPIIKLTNDGFFLSKSFLNAMKKLPKGSIPSLWAYYNITTQSKINPPDVYKNFLIKISNENIENYFQEKSFQANYADVVGNWTTADWNRIVKLYNQTDQLIKVVFQNYWIVSPPPPSLSGSIVPAVLNALKSKISSKIDKDFFINLAKLLSIAETRVTAMPNKPDGQFNLIKELENSSLSSNSSQSFGGLLPKFDSIGSTNIVVVDSKDGFVSLSAGLGSAFGSRLFTSHGQILNNALSQFTSGPNAPGPSKQPWTALTPIAVFNGKRKCGPRFVMSSQGETTMEISSTIIQAIANAVTYTCDAKDCLDLDLAIRQARLSVNNNYNSTNQTTTTVEVENGISNEIKEALKNVGFSIVKADQDKVGIAFAAGKVRHEYNAAADSLRLSTVQPAQF